MKDVFNNIDELILTKSYKDLSPDELVNISELASTESDFNQLKATMLAVQKQISAEELIEAKPETKAALMREFKSARPAVISSSSRMGLGFFFPKGPLQRMPGLQILTAAACLLMVFTVLRNIDINGTEKKVAYEETTKEVKTPNTAGKTNQEIVTEEQINEGKDVKIDTKSEMPIVVERNNKEEVLDLKNETIAIKSVDKVNTITDGVITGASTGKFIAPAADVEIYDEIAFAEEDEAEIVSDVLIEETEEEISLEKESISSNKVSAERATSAGSVQMELADASVISATKDFKKKADKASIKLSRTLEEDAELIDLFYTAM
jgi:hypothetical protein